MNNITNQSILELETFLNTHQHAFSDGGAQESVMKTFRREKPLSSIELHDAGPEFFTTLINELSKFFFVGHYCKEKPDSSGLFDSIYLSRLKHVVDTAVDYAIKFKGNFDKYADIIGILFGYSTKEVAEYCSKERFDGLDLTK